MIYIIAYTLRCGDIMKVVPVIESIGDDYYHITEDAFLVYSKQPLNITKINSELREVITTEDLLFISEINPNVVDGWLVKSAWEFIEKYK